MARRDDGIIAAWIEFARKQDEGFFGERGQWCRRGAAQHVSSRHHDHELFVDQWFDRNIITIVDGRADEGDVDLPGTQSRDEQGGAARLWSNNNIRILQSVFTDDCWNERVEVSRTG